MKWSIHHSVQMTQRRRLLQHSCTSPPETRRIEKRTRRANARDVNGTAGQSNPCSSILRCTAAQAVALTRPSLAAMPLATARCAG